MVSPQSMSCAAQQTEVNNTECVFLTPSFAFVHLQDAFEAFHVDKVLVSKYLKSLQIGELALDQPSIEPTKNVSLSWKSDQR